MQLSTRETLLSCQKQNRKSEDYCRCIAGRKEGITGKCKAITFSREETYFCGKCTMQISNKVTLTLKK